MTLCLQTKSHKISSEVVLFLKNRQKVRKKDTMFADLLSEKITDIVRADTKSGSQ
jgi:hypothetical protein